MRAPTTIDLRDGSATPNDNSFSGDHTAQGNDIIKQDPGRERHEKINGKNESTRKEAKASAVETVLPHGSQGELLAEHIA
jgi:hypothetical protein